MPTIDRTATMTSNSTPLPNVTSASTIFDATFPAWTAFEKNEGIGWAAQAGQTTGWLKYDFGGNIWAASGYSVTGDWNGGAFSPKDWTFEGSNDDVSWTVLDVQSGQIFTLSEKKSYSFANSAFYRYYQLRITANGGGAQVEVGEMTILAPDKGASFLFNVVS